MIYNIINNKPLPIYAKGKNSREWIYVNDHCEALIKLFYKGKVGENIILVLVLIAVTFLLWKILQFSNKKIKIGKKSKYICKDRPGHDFRYALSSYKIRKNMNWKPKTSLSQVYLKLLIGM